MHSVVTMLGAHALLLAGIGAAAAQHSEPKAVAGRTITIWQVEQQRGFTTSRVVYARNDSTAPIAVTGMRLSKCINLSIPCGAATSRIQILAPGQTAEVLEVVAADIRKSFSFVDELDWRTATECIGPRPAAPDDSSSRKSRMPNARQIILQPPWEVPRDLHGKQVDVQFFVADNGRVDSVGVTGILDKGYLAKFRRSMLDFRFSPGLDRGCPVRGTTSISMTF